MSFYRAEVNKYRSFGSSSAKVVHDSTRLEGKAGFKSKSENLGQWKFCPHIGVLQQCSFACITKVKMLFFVYPIIIYTNCSTTTASMDFLNFFVKCDVTHFTVFIFITRP